MEMIERVARALREKWSVEVFDRKSDVGWENEIDNARAAIEAMREPTEAMHEAANETSVYYDDFSCGDGNITLGLPGYPTKFVEIWSDMIDAALKEST